MEAANKIEKKDFQRVKLLILLKILFFNLFIMGFLANFVAILSINWIVGKNYVFGIFKYCKETDNSSQSRHYIFYTSGQKLMHKEVTDSKCFNWNASNRPSRLLFCLFFQF